MSGLEVNAFTVAVEWLLQQHILNGEISVYMGKAKKARGFDSIHDKENIRFVIDPLYVQDPEETHEILKKLYDWVQKWNEVEVAKRY